MTRPIVWIMRLETDLNRRVYTLFDLSAAGVKLIEESTRYRYGEVWAIGSVPETEPR